MSNRVRDTAYDAIVQAGRVVCPVNRLDGRSRIALRDGRIAAVGDDVEGTASQAFDFPEGILLPGLIDLHAHPATSGSVFGVDPDRWMLSSGTTTVMSQGDAGADNLSRYIDETILTSQVRVRLAINLSRIGESTRAGCFESIEDADVGACAKAVEQHREHVWGIAVNVSNHCCGTTEPREVMRRGLEAAQRTGLPVLFGMRRPEDWPLAEQLALLRVGDVVTYCFRSTPHCIVDEDRVLPEVRDARERGVIFDVGHGAASFDFTVAEAAIRDGFAPDTISTDLQIRHIEEQMHHDLPLVMSKLQAAGMREEDIFAAVTKTPAKTLGMDDEISSLTPGAWADLTVLRTSEAPVTLSDCFGHERSARRWQNVFTVRAGEIVSLPTT
jgi:dihydroorotase